ncbi:MAG: succinyl-diaminopimelate desuccinylase [Pseudohongiella sp.]|nr:MAG: succinyl-diaminopimelate desuccinylase [Pseudohongiella sp.]
MSKTLALSKQLIRRSSVTPEDAGCQELLAGELAAMGFHIEHLQFEDVKNLWATRGDTGPLFVFAGHTDVVPPGPLSEWKHPPFEAEEEDGFLYGRGAADMKTSLAAMITAVESFTEKHGEAPRIAFLITSDEEGIAINGTRKMVEVLQERGISIDHCLIGEPSSTEKLGDVVKIGRRGSLSGNLIVEGVQGHVAYPHLAENPIHSAMPVLAELLTQEWDKGNECFPPTSMQISNIAGGTGANNVIPRTLKIDFNFRFSTELVPNEIKERVEEVLTSCCSRYGMNWHLSGLPFLTPPGKLRSAVVEAIAQVTGISTEESTTGGTSDGRFISPMGAEVVELGPCNDTIHKVNERVKIADIENLRRIYLAVLENCLLEGPGE